MEGINYTKPSWQEASRRDLIWDENGQPRLEIMDFTRGGKRIKLYGRQALHYADPGEIGLSQGSSVIAPAYYGDDDYRDSYSYQAGHGIRKFLDDPKPTFVGKLLNHGPLTGAATGGIGGFLGGKLLNLIFNNEQRHIPFDILGLIGGGAYGAIRGRIQESLREKNATANIVKSAMFRDPRNFILERLQGANDISPYEKAQLASRVRQMNIMEAERLKEQVRAAAGFGVGAIIARFVFGAGWLGTTVGGLAGSLFGKLAPRGLRQPTGIFSGNFF